MHCQLLFWTPLFQQVLAIPDPVIIDESSPDQMQVSREVQPISKCKQKVDSEISQTHGMIKSLDKSISSLEMQLATAKAAKAEREKTSSTLISKMGSKYSKNRPKLFFVLGIMTAFNSRKRRDSIRDNWMAQVVENNQESIFVLLHLVAGGVLDRAIKAEDEQHNVFLRLNHVEGYHQLSSKTQRYFSTAVANWDAEYCIKVDDDIHVNLEGSNTMNQNIGNLVGEGNKYFRHATRQIYALSKDLGKYITTNRHALHRYANEYVSVGSWFIGFNMLMTEAFAAELLPWDLQISGENGRNSSSCGEGKEAIWRSSF